MQVILTESVDKLGEQGDVVDVADGYARNFLFPKQLAVEATKEQIQEMKMKEQQRAKKEAAKREDAQKMAEKMGQKEYVFSLKAGEEGRLFGSVTSQDIEEKLADEGFDIDRRNIELEDNIKELGTHKISIKIYQDIRAEIKVKVKEQ